MKRPDHDVDLIVHSSSFVRSRQGRLRSGIRQFAAALLWLTSVSCEQRGGAPHAQTGDGIQVTDPTGRVVQLAKPATRVISLVPAVTDMIVELGAADRLVARTQFDTHPQLTALPSTANALNPSIEWILAQQPELVIVWQDQPARSVVDRLSTMGVAVYGARTESIADVLRGARDLGALLGLSQRADSVAARIFGQLDAVRHSVRNAAPKSVLYLISVEPPMVAGPGTYIEELIQIAGGSNAFRDAQAVWPQVSLEEIVRRKPDAIVVAQETPSDVTARLRNLPGWRGLAAVRDGQVLIVDANLFNRPGPRLPEAAAQLARFLHPGITR